MPEFFWPSLAAVTPHVGIWLLRGFLGGFKLFLEPLLCWKVDRRGLVEITRSPIVSLVIGKVAVLLFAVAIVDTTRDAFVNIGTFLEDVDGTVTSTRDAFDIVAPLDDVVDLVT